MTSCTKPEPSWRLLTSGSAEAFVEALCQEALAHPAVNHQYLVDMAAGRFDDMPAALRDFCYQYHFYSAEFTSYLEGVIGGLPCPTHRETLRHNLEEERGHNDAENPDGIPHTELFMRFKRASGVTEAFEASTKPIASALIWRDLFLQKCQSRQLGVGLGAIGIGTEMIVSRIYGYLHDAVANYSNMSPQDYIFLRLHLDCDDEHAADLKAISIELAEDHDVREALRFGVFSSLNLRNNFWDVMLARAAGGK